ncbi:MAG: hypothetical protein JST89_04310 [Cyanobacteria bacterium SZAS-4]|nr:hypothetical protein [Cyanobacteria bacterium SZAS-4]
MQEDPRHEVAIKELRHILEDNARTMPEAGEFFYYLGLGEVNRVMPYQDPNWPGFGLRGDHFCKRMFILKNSFDAIITILHKIKWLTSQWQASILPEDDWQAYIETDIHAFHVEMRSLFDSIAKSLNSAGEKSDQLSDSFHTLRNKAKNKPTQVQTLLGKELTDLIASADWFDESRDFRDDLTHFEKDVEVGYATFPSGIKVVFRTVVGREPRPVYAGPQMFKLNDDWILFEPYAGYYFGRFWYLLNQVCKLAGERLSLQKSGFSWVPTRLKSSLDMIGQSLAVMENAERCNS